MDDLIGPVPPTVGGPKRKGPPQSFLIQWQNLKVVHCKYFTDVSYTSEASMSDMAGYYILFSFLSWILEFELMTKEPYWYKLIQTNIQILSKYASEGKSNKPSWHK